ncbi:hypothetical protein BDR03DRAFT_824397, partial [Suillus americanus]
VTDDAQAAIMLKTIWLATNETLKTQWQQQLDADVLEAEEQRHILAEEEAQHLAAEKARDAITAKEDQKLKDRIHHIAIPNRSHPNQANEPVLVSDFALRKLDKAQYVKLYYWTNQGLADARLNFWTGDDDSLV